ncbi:protein Lines homolog 1 isoform X2 [Bos indicus x Bos taurus]|uniref:protein Lines homolog 1 isoform X2 n=1 Tax=Bos taurus TaxID=9913 RepID=UPI000383D49A|nr:protein Lines homolog 1 isoform X2 [Bos taurus]XP_019839077.1 PREDICTED: protein Lines homolog 1 isoform X2 [Bos indicus]XP_027377450.1 protein Lines homolog 1 isoform X2 [Bos indicus x Bos taurus]
METFFEALEQLYKKVLLGATLENDSHDYIFYLYPAFSDQDCSTTTSSDCSNAPDVQDKQEPSSVSLPTFSVAPMCLQRHSQMSSTREIMLLQLTVIKVMITRILSVETEFHAKEKYRDIIKILLKSSDIESQLTCMFQNSEKLLSHMAAKCLALILYFQLKEKITLSNSWISFCQKNISEYSESNKVVYCLWILTFVIKEIFKDTSSQKTEILKQFLTPFDTLFEAFYKSLLSQHFENHQDASKLINSLICFLELLELLIASRIYLKLHYTCQRILFLKPSCVFDVITWPIQAFVKRKLIIFIKKCLLCKVGEDLCRGSVPTFMPPDNPLDVDLLALASAVLQAVDLGLLRTLSVRGKCSCFGGGEVLAGYEHDPGPDHVILRALSLLIIRSLEIKFQNCSSANEMKVDYQRFMSELLTFLKPHLQPSLQSHNLCEWLSRVFIEQDDDMLEAAKALLGIYLKLTRNSNSAEASPLAVVGSHTDAHSWVSWASAASSEPLNHGVTLEKAHTKLQANCLSTPGASQSLVDYDSSDDSEEGSTSLCLVNSRLTSSHQEAMKKTQDTFGASGDKKELSPESQSRPLVTEESNTLFSVYCDIAPNNTASEVGISYRTVKCFEELQGAIYRLQKKNLFPYNPTALLKLLKHIETIYNKSMTPS